MIDAIECKICEVMDFPKPGIGFKDITPLLEDTKAYKLAINTIADWAADKKIDIVVGIESRGFLFAAPLALQLGTGFVPVRKRGKLPRQTVEAVAPNEYAMECFQIHSDAIKQGQRVVIVDDLLATGGSALSAVELVEKLGGEVAGIVFVVELCFLGGCDKIKAIHPDIEVYSLVKYTE